MRYLGQLGVAAQVAARAGSDERAATGRPDPDLHEAPALSDERAAAWRDWAGAGTREAPPREAPPRATPPRGAPPRDGRPREASPREARPRSFQPAADPDRATTSARAQSLTGDPARGRRDGEPGDDPATIAALVPARRRFVDWIAQVVADADPDQTMVSPRSMVDAAPSVDEEPALADSRARSSGAGRLSALLIG